MRAIAKQICSVSSDAVRLPLSERHIRKVNIMKREYMQKIKDGVLTNDILLECWIGADTYISKYAYLAKKWQHSYYPEHQVYPEKRNQYIKIRGMIQQVLYQDYTEEELKVKIAEMKE